VNQQLINILIYKKIVKQLIITIIFFYKNLHFYKKIEYNPNYLILNSIMSYSNKPSNYNTSEVNRKKKEEKRRKEYKENKGNWEYSFFQKKIQS